MVVGARGLILVTSDGGMSWRSPVILGGAPTRDLLDVDLAGLKGFAVGGSGTLLSTSDGGETWTRVPAVTFETIATVAAAPDGSAVAGTDVGSLLTGTGTTWVVAATPAQPVLHAVASTQTTWGDAWPDLVVSLGSSLLGSTDGSSFGWSLESTVGPWPALAWAGMPSGDLLLAGTGGAVYAVDSALPSAVVPRASTGIGDALAAAAPGGQSVAYVLGTDGRAARTLSSARSAATLGAPAGADHRRRLVHPGRDGPDRGARHPRAGEQGPRPIVGAAQVGARGRRPPGVRGASPSRPPSTARTG